MTPEEVTLSEARAEWAEKIFEYIQELYYEDVENLGLYHFVQTYPQSSL
jgi:hypothetical protein